MMFTLGTLILIQAYQPYETKYANKTETFHEMAILFLIYVALCFTDFVPDSEARYNMGYVYLALNILMLSALLYILVHNTVKVLRRALMKRKICMVKKKKKNANNNSKITK